MKDTISLNCNFCKASFKSKLGLRGHEEFMHKGVKFTCNVCAKDFSRKVTLKRHFLSVHEGLTYKCEQQCDTEYKQILTYFNFE